MTLERNKKVTLRHLSLASLRLWEIGTLFWELPLLKCFEILSKYTLEPTVCKKLHFARLLPPQVGSIFLKPVKTMRSVMSIVMSTAGWGAARTRFKCTFCHLVTMWPQACNLIFINVSFIICRIELIMPISQDFCRIKCDDGCEASSPVPGPESRLLFKQHLEMAEGYNLIFLLGS